MPELPEVEALRRGLSAHLPGQRILKVDVRKPKLVAGRGTSRRASSATTRRFTDGLTGEIIHRLERRAKNLLLIMSSGKVLVIHLKMSGQLVYRQGKQTKVLGGHPIEISEFNLPNAHTHIIITLHKGVLYYNDTRMFGHLLLYQDMAAVTAAGHFDKLGLEPDDPNFTADYLYQGLRHLDTTLKVALLQQTIVVGLGNIYADECCFHAGIRPTKRTMRITRAEADRLHGAIAHVIPRAITLGGSSVASYRLADGSRGNYAREHMVYGAGDTPCKRCATTLRRLSLGGRTTVYCPNCQK